MEVAGLQGIGIAQADLGMVARIAASTGAGHWQKGVVVGVGTAVGILLVEDPVVAIEGIQKAHGIAAQQHRPVHREACLE